MPFGYVQYCRRICNRTCLKIVQTLQCIALVDVLINNHEVFIKHLLQFFWSIYCPSLCAIILILDLYFLQEVGQSSCIPLQIGPPSHENGVVWLWLQQRHIGYVSGWLDIGLLCWQVDGLMGKWGTAWTGTFACTGVNTTAPPEALQQVHACAMVYQPTTVLQQVPPRAPS